MDISRGKTINALYTKKDLAMPPVVFRKKRPIMVSQDWFLHWSMVVKGVKTIHHPPY